MNDELLLNPSECARVLEVSEVTIRRAIRCGKLKTVDLLIETGEKVRVSDLFKWKGIEPFEIIKDGEKIINISRYKCSICNDSKFRYNKINNTYSECLCHHIKFTPVSIIDAA